MKIDLTIRIVCDEDDIESCMQGALEEIAEVLATVEDVADIDYTNSRETFDGDIAIEIAPAEEA